MSSGQVVTTLWYNGYNIINQLRISRGGDSEKHILLKPLCISLSNNSVISTISDQSVIYTTLLLTFTIWFIVSSLRFCNFSFQFSYYISTGLELSNRFLLIVAPMNIVSPFGYRPFIANIRTAIRFVKFPKNICEQKK